MSWIRSLDATFDRHVDFWYSLAHDGDGLCHPVFLEALDELAGADPELGRLLEAGLVTNDLFAPARDRMALERLERVRLRPAAETIGEKLLLSLLAYHNARAGVASARRSFPSRAARSPTERSSERTLRALPCRPSRCSRWPISTRC